MTSLELNAYRQHVRAEAELGMYVPRRFTAATIEGGTDPDGRWKVLGYTRGSPRTSSD
jgi:hypothetical protein